MENYVQWKKIFYVALVIKVCLVLTGDVIADLDPCSRALLCNEGTQMAKYGTRPWRYTVKIIENPYCTQSCVNCSTGGIGLPRNITYNISELHPGQFFQISWVYSADVTNLRGFLIQFFLSAESECIRINHELCILLNLRQITPMTGDGFPADFYLNCFYNGTPNAVIRTVVSSHPKTNNCFSEDTLPSPHERTIGSWGKLTPTMSPVPSALATTKITDASVVVGVLVFFIVIGAVLFFVKKVKHRTEEAELELELENIKDQVEMRNKEKSLKKKILKKHKLILGNNKREIETCKSETVVNVERSNDSDRRESSTSKNESCGTHSSERLKDEDIVNDLYTHICHVSSRHSTLAQDAIPIEDMYDEYNRQLIAINMD